MRWNRGLLLEGFSESAELLEQLCLVRVLTRMSLVVFDYPLLLHRAPSVLLACESGLSSTPIGVRPGSRSVSLGRLLAEGRPFARQIAPCAGADGAATRMPPGRRTRPLAVNQDLPEIRSICDVGEDLRRSTRVPRKTASPPQVLRSRTNWAA